MGTHTDFHVTRVLHHWKARAKAAEASAEAFEQAYYELARAASAFQLAVQTNLYHRCPLENEDVMYGVDQRLTDQLLKANASAEH